MSSGTPTPVRVAYVMSRFPKLTETFVLYEALAVRRQGVGVELWPLLRERTAIAHPEAAAEAARAHYVPFLSPAVLASVLWFARHRPVALVGAFAAVVAGCWGSLNLLVGGVGIFPKVVHAARQMEAAGIDHVHCHFATHPALAGFVIRRLTRIPFSFVAHGSDLHVDRHMLPQKVAEAAFVVAISEDNRRVILETCGERWADKVIVVHCGVDTSVFAPSEAVSDGVLDVLCIGTLHEVKGQRHLLDALQRLGSRVRFRCTFVGEGSDRDALEARARDLGIAEHVQFVGRLTRPDVRARLEVADVLVAPSVPTRAGKREGIPVVLMEAMSAAVPVVASRLSGIPELVEDGRSGLLVPPGDPDALAEALERIAADPASAAALGRCGREQVLRAFDLETNAAALARRFVGVAA